MTEYTIIYKYFRVKYFQKRERNFTETFKPHAMRQFSACHVYFKNSKGMTL